MLKGQELKLKELWVSQVLKVLSSLAKGILQLQRLGIYHLDITFRNILQFKKNNRREFRIIGFDWAFKINDSISRQPFEQTRKMIRSWLRYNENCQLEYLLLFNIFNGIRQEPDRMKEVFEIKRRANCSEEEKIRKVIQHLERYMFYSHKKQFCNVACALFEIFDK